ncbi:dihydroanticapsin dehydrogenase [Burkholderiales bacterium]|nr:dihydroanticapsin dehydrogenase [Burkholderiales bacterium]
MSDAARFAGRVAIVTGGASGLGLATARRLHGEGARVAILDLPAARPSDAAARIARTALGLEADVTDAHQVGVAVERATSMLGPVDALVTSAGVSRVGNVLDTTPDEFARVLAVNLTGTFVVVQAVAQRMVARRRGRIVLLGSISGTRIWNDRAAYAASKGGVVALAKSCAVDLAPHGIAVNSVSPGPIATPQTAALHGPTIRGAVEAAVPMARYGTPDEVAAAVVWLLSDDARFVTGHDLVVDGGLTAAAIRYDRGRADGERGSS